MSLKEIVWDAGNVGKEQKKKLSPVLRVTLENSIFFICSDRKGRNSTKGQELILTKRTKSTERSTDVLKRTFGGIFLLETNDYLSRLLSIW